MNIDFQKPQDHGHSHGGKPCHGHGHEVEQPQSHGHSHGGQPCHGHGHGFGHSHQQIGEESKEELTTGGETPGEGANAAKNRRKREKAKAKKAAEAAAKNQ